MSAKRSIYSIMKITESQLINYKNLLQFLEDLFCRYDHLDITSGEFCDILREYLKGVNNNVS